MVEILTILAGIAGGIGGVVAWFNNLPPWMKYCVFLAGLGTDVAVAGFLNIQGLTGWIVSQPFIAFGFANVAITSPEVMLLALFIPLIGLFFNLYH